MVRAYGRTAMTAPRELTPEKLGPPWTCHNCLAEGELPVLPSTCPHCGSSDVYPGVTRRGDG